jgi:hypothetical protein
MTQPIQIVKSILLIALVVMVQVEANTSAIKETDQIKQMTYNFVNRIKDPGYTFA